MRCHPVMLLGLVLLWSAPVANCDGSGLTDLDHYEVPIFHAEIIGWLPCSEDDLTPCPIYDRSIVRFVTNVPELSLADPRVGEVIGWPDTADGVEAIDVAGNSSADCSP